MLIKNNVSLEFKFKVDEIKEKLRLPRNLYHIYLLNGKSIFELAQIPRSESIIVISMIIFFFFI